MRLKEEKMRIDRGLRKYYEINMSSEWVLKDRRVLTGKSIPHRENTGTKRKV